MKRLHQAGLHPIRFFESYSPTTGGNNYLPANSPLDNGANLSSNLTGNYLYAAPFWLAKDFFLRHFGFILNTVSTPNTNVSWGIYADNWSDLSLDVRYPGKKLVEAYYDDIPQADFYTSACDPPMMLKGNRLYWAVFSFDTGGAQTWRCGQTTLNLLGFQFGDGTYPLVSKRGLALSRTHTQSLPDPFPSGASDQRFIPTMFIRELDQSGS